jgi:hypothetical protein
MITVHARHGKEVHLHIGISPLDFADEVHPEFCPPQLGLLLSDKGNIILLPAGHHASLTTRAFIQIDYHAPTVHARPLKKAIGISGYQEVSIRASGYQGDEAGFT